MRNFFVVLGGMGTLATESFVRVLDRMTGAHRDQDFLDYVVFNHATVPDRTEFILGRSKDDPFPYLAEDVRQATAMGASFMVMACNTAHQILPRLQALTPVPILSMPQATIDWADRHYPAKSHPRMGYMGTEGSRHAAIYQGPADSAGYQLVDPDPVLQDRVSGLIYDDVKEGRLDRDRYLGVLGTFLNDYRCDSVLLGCTELSVLNEAYPMPQLPIVDSQAVLAQVTLDRARALRDRKDSNPSAAGR